LKRRPTPEGYGGVALVLKKELEDRISALDKPIAAGEAEGGSWPDISLISTR
jgi:hypothetical protein